MMVFNISNKVRCLAHGELIEELKSELNNKPIEIQKLEIDYFKQYLLKEIGEPISDETLNSMKEAIKEEKEKRELLKEKIDKLDSIYSASWEK
ncbi:MAG: hypothetical protein E6845_11255 [Clostridium sp.]|uniref:hypothetical protein n=1 Tax=Clostridium sp. TaxID=1506 RepID=UPI002904D7E1|nr:hypothetical protein [Clostridium sp.]MDU1603535.1 hypothetical protein [Clostridium sp.]